MAADETVAELQRELEASRAEVQQLREKAAQFETVSSELDDDSYDAAQAFQLKKELTEVRDELAKQEEMKQELADAKHDLAELRAKNEELELQQSRKSTRTDMQRIKSEKDTREEVERLHKELRQMERNTKSQASMVEAQLKASKDSLQRAAEKTQAIQRRLDLVDKERMDLKLENQRLARKLEKADSYAEKKRAQMEVETQEIEITNLKRKNSKLENKLSMSTMNLSDIDKMVSGPITFTSPKRADSRTDSHVSSGPSSPIPMTLGEARVVNLEKEVQSLEQHNSNLETQNQSLKDELAAVQQKAMILIAQVEQLQAGMGAEREREDVLTQLPQYQNSLPPQPAANNGPVQDESIFEELQQEVLKLRKQLEDKATELRVRVKEMKATNDELKRQVEELEMEKLKLELGEDEEEGGDQTDTEDDDSKEKEATPRPVQLAEEDNSEMKVLRERLMSIQDELVQATQSNDTLQSQLEKQKADAEQFMQSIETELNEVVQAAAEDKSREQKLIERYEDLKQKLNEQQEEYNDMIRQIAGYKATIIDQEDEIILLKVQKDQVENQLAEILESTKEEPVLPNGVDADQHTLRSPPPTKKKPRLPAIKKPREKTPSRSPEKGATQEKTKSPTPKPQKVKTPTPPAEEKPKSPTPTPVKLDTPPAESLPPANIEPAAEEEIDGPSEEVDTPSVPPEQEREKSPPPPAQEEEKEPPPVEEKQKPAPQEKEKPKSGGKKLGGILSKFQGSASEKVESPTPQPQKKPSHFIKKRPAKEWPPRPKK